MVMVMGNSTGMDLSTNPDCDCDRCGYVETTHRKGDGIMSDYISRQAAIDETQNGMDLDRIKSIGVYVPNNVEGNKPMESYILRNAAINEIYHHFPSLSHTEAAMVLHTVPSADVIEVVRCRDCARYDTHDKRCRYWNHGIGVDLDGFCSKGVRTDER